MWNVSPKRWQICTKLYGVTHQNAVILYGRSLPPVDKCSRTFSLPRYGVKSRSRRPGSLALRWRCSRDVASWYGAARCNISLFLICHACNSERHVTLFVVTHESDMICWQRENHQREMEVRKLASASRQTSQIRCTVWTLRHWTGIGVISRGVVSNLQTDHQPDATIFQFIILTFIYSSTCCGRSDAHHQELNDCSSSLWFYLRIVVTVVLCSWWGRPDHEHNTAITTIQR